MSLDEVTSAVLAVPGVTGLHDLHVWVLTSGKNSLTVHVVHAPEILSTAIITNVKNVVAERFNVFHTTIQCELVACQHTEDGCNFTGPAQEM